MPVYQYIGDSDAPCPHCAVVFEVVQSMHDNPLTQCPCCGRAVRKVFSAPAIQGTGGSADLLTNKNLAAKGFTKYQKSGDGTYEKVTGKGPDVIQR